LYISKVLKVDSCIVASVVAMDVLKTFQMCRCPLHPNIHVSCSDVQALSSSTPLIQIILRMETTHLRERNSICVDKEKRWEHEIKNLNLRWMEGARARAHGHSTSYNPHRLTRLAEIGVVPLLYLKNYIFIPIKS
jgi:hypothetical protein